MIVYKNSAFTEEVTNYILGGINKELKKIESIQLAD